MPANLYGPGDNFHPENSHVIPGLMQRFHRAKVDKAAQVYIWGSGTARREFLYVDDLADALLFLMNNYEEPEHINAGWGQDLTIMELARLMAEVVGYEGRLELDPGKPDGTPQKLLDISKINQLGWQAQTGLAEGLALTYEWYLKYRA
jgi:GDP-L-fucose synthase